MRDGLEKLQNVEKPVRRPFSNGGRLVEKRRQRAGAVSGDEPATAKGTPDPWA